MRSTRVDAGAGTGEETTDRSGGAPAGGPGPAEESAPGGKVEAAGEVEAAGRATSGKAAPAEQAEGPTGGDAEGPPGGSAGGDADTSVPVIGTLSPSRAGDFMTCPLLYRFRVIDRIPERPTPAAVRGTLVHAVLERLFDLPAAERTATAAVDLLAPEWERLLAADAELAELFPDEAAREAWLTEADGMVRRYFTLEDPRRLEPARRELYVETVLDSGLQLRGYIDRLDVAPTGEVRVVDYKTGRAPKEMFEARALFQMKFYALVLWRLRGTVPRLLQLIYLGNGEILYHTPDEADLRATERKVQALWRAISRARDSGDWRPRRSRLCDWCDHKARCPEFGGTPPPLPQIPPAGTETTVDATAAVPPAATGAPAPRRPGDEG